MTSEKTLERSAVREPRNRGILFRELSTYGVVGAVNFAVDVGLYQAMYAHFHQGALVSKAVSTAVTTTLAYFMHREWSFGHRAGREKAHQEFALFLGLSAVSLVLGFAVIGTVRYGFDVTDVLLLQLANVASIGLGVIFRFWAYRKWVFVD